jgi:hypothetical protein
MLSPVGNICLLLVPFSPELCLPICCPKSIKIRICKTIILPLVLYGYETWPLTLREEHRLRVFDNRMLRRVFLSKMDKVIGGSRELHNEDLHNFYSSLGVIRIIN